MEDYYTHRNSAHRFSIRKVDDRGDIQMIDGEGLTDEQFTKIMRVYPHGFSSHSLDDAHMVVLALGGRRDMLVALGGEHAEKRPRNLKKGESVLYDSAGNVVYMKVDGGISCNAKKGPIQFETQDDSITANAAKELKLISKQKAAFGSKDNITYLGGDGSDGTYAFVMTEAGLSTKVKARL